MDTDGHGLKGCMYVMDTDVVVVINSRRRGQWWWMDVVKVEVIAVESVVVVSLHE